MKKRRVYGVIWCAGSLLQWENQACVVYIMMGVLGV